jgi:hypothetical protein
MGAAVIAEYPEWGRTSQYCRWLLGSRHHKISTVKSAYGKSSRLLPVDELCGTGALLVSLFGLPTFPPVQRATHEAATIRVTTKFIFYGIRFTAPH